MHIDFQQSLMALPRLDRLNFLRSSLSTISEERTNATATTLDDAMHKSTQIAFIESLLKDVQINSTLLNEILSVFKPSSKAGTFKRNVPIRITSPHKSLRRDDEHLPEIEKRRSAASHSSPRSPLSCSAPDLYSSPDGKVRFTLYAQTFIDYYSIIVVDEGNKPKSAGSS